MKLALNDGNTFCCQTCTRQRYVLVPDPISPKITDTHVHVCRPHSIICLCIVSCIMEY